MAIWQWAVTAAGGIVAIAGAVSAIKRWFQPLLDARKDVEALKQQQRQCQERFNKIVHRQEDAREANQAVYKALISIMNHMIDGNGIENLKAAREDLSRFIIEH